MAYTLAIPVRQSDAALDQLAAQRQIMAVAVPTPADSNRIWDVPVDRRYAIYENRATAAAIEESLGYAKRFNVPRIGWYHDKRWWDVIAGAPYKRPGVFAMPQMYRDKGEPDDKFQQFMRDEYDELTDLGWNVVPVLGVHSRNGLLSTKDCCHNVILFSELKIPNVVIFAEHRADVPPEVYPYLAQLTLSVMTIGQLPTLEWPAPPSPGLAMRKTILCRT